MGESGTSERSLALGTLGFGLAGLALLASTWILNPYPADASCYTTDGYAAIKAHADANVTLALLGLLSTGVAASVCLAGAIKAKGHRALFLFGFVPLVGLGAIGLLVLLVSGFYCQN